MKKISLAIKILVLSVSAAILAPCDGQVGGIGSTVSLSPAAKVIAGLSVLGGSVGESRKSIETWLQKQVLLSKELLRWKGCYER